MKKFTFLLCIIFITTSVSKAQDIKFSEKILDTILANDKSNVALFFPEPIKQGIVGSNNYVFTYNREIEQPMGLLQATPGNDSNLLIISTNGYIFSYIVRYSDTLRNLNYFISEANSIGNENPNFNKESLGIADNISTSNISEIESDKKAVYYNFSSYYLHKDQSIGNLKKQKDGIILNLKNIVFNGEELYFIINLKNNSPIDYDLSFLNISVETRKKGKKKSIQKLVQEPLYKFRFPSMVKKGETAEFVYVIPKFSIADDKMVIIDLKEGRGERDIKLKIKKKFINNPN